MKKFIAFLALIALAVGLNAQIPITVGGLATAANNSITAGTSLSSTGRIIAATSYVYEVKVASPFFYQWSVRLLQKTTTDNTATVAFYGALENSANAYKQIGSTINWKGTTTDSTMIVTSTGATAANALNWRYIKVVITPTDTAWVKHVLFNCLPAVK